MFFSEDYKKITGKYIPASLHVDSLNYNVKKQLPFFWFCNLYLELVHNLYFGQKSENFALKARL